MTIDTIEFRKLLFNYLRGQDSTDNLVTQIDAYVESVVADLTRERDEARALLETDHANQTDEEILARMAGALQSIAKPEPRPMTSINPLDLVCSTYRKGGNSGWLPKPDDCCRILHVPTGVMVVQEGGYRSIHQVRAAAMAKLPAALAEYRLGGGTQERVVGYVDPIHLRIPEGRDGANAMITKFQHLFQIPLFTKD